MRPRNRFSATLSVPTRLSSCMTMWTPRRWPSALRAGAYGWPPSVMRPPSGVVRPQMMRASVDLPAPFAPTRA